MSVIDGFAVGQSVSTGLNNSIIYADSVTLGAMQPKATQTGSYYLDEFASFRPWPHKPVRNQYPRKSGHSVVGLFLFLLDLDDLQ